jgi:hypothetical protein
MEDFKLGDEVLVLEKAIDGNVEIGTVGFITLLDADGTVGVGGSFGNWFYGGNGGKLELVKPKRQHQCEGLTGLTKRETFAMAAMQGLLAGGYCIDDPNNRLNDVSSEAVALADALLKELSK